MTDAKHTPEPWEYSAAVQNNGPNYYAITTGKWGEPSVAECLKEANARLIAAAPEMLAALCEVIADIEAYCEDHMSNNPTDVTVGLPRLRAAVYKATEKEAK